MSGIVLMCLFLHASRLHASCAPFSCGWPVAQISCLTAQPLMELLHQIVLFRERNCSFLVEPASSRAGDRGMEKRPKNPSHTACRGNLGCANQRQCALV